MAMKYRILFAAVAVITAAMVGAGSASAVTWDQCENGRDPRTGHTGIVFQDPKNNTFWCFGGFYDGLEVFGGPPPGEQFDIVPGPKPY
jgi:hypothetical protein